jgi:hypothetical protein
MKPTLEKWRPTLEILQAAMDFPKTTQFFRPPSSLDTKS